MEWFTKCSLLVILAVCYASVCVFSEDRIVQTFNDELFDGGFDDTEGAADTVQDLIGQFLEDVDAKATLREAILDDALVAGGAAEQQEYQKRGSAWCRGASGRCIMKGPNPNTASRVLPFGKRDESAETTVRRARGQRRKQASNSRILLPFGKKR